MEMVAPQRVWMPVMPRRRRNEDEDPGPLARYLRRLRGERGLTQKEVQRLAGWADSNSYYSDIERGHIGSPSREKIAALERVFGTEPGDIERRVRRRDWWLDSDEEPPAEPLPSNVVDFPDPRLQLVVERIKSLHTRFPRSNVLTRTDKFLLDLGEEFIEQQPETAGEADHEDTATGTNVP